VLAGSIAALGLCALIASVIPAQRAASINPVEALRTE
jgi:ABC-type lipoprotein release transport system permease subunit